MSERASLRAEFERGAKIQSEMAFQGKTIAVRTDRIEMAGLPPQRWDIVLHPGAVVIVPVADDGKIVLIKQWRRAISEITVELPAGTLDQKNEEVAKCAQRELQEEIGFRAEEIIPLGGFFSAPGFCTEFLHLFFRKKALLSWRSICADMAGVQIRTVRNWIIRNSKMPNTGNQ